MSTGARFLTVVDTYPGYCQNCHEPQVVGRIAVAGWLYQGSICSGCLGQLTDEVQRRGNAGVTDTARNGNVLAVAVGGNGHGQ